MTATQGLEGDQEVAVKREQLRSRKDRLRTRMARTNALTQPSGSDDTGQIAKATTALQQLYDTGPRPPHISVRSTFVKRRQPATGEMSDRTPPEEPLPPMLTLASPNGIAQQLELLALFAAQAQALPKSGAQHKLPFPLVARDGENLGWTDLVVPETKLTPTGVYAISRGDARLRQLKRAIRVLASKDFVHLPQAAATRDKFEGFQLLDEGGARPVGNPVRYEIPDRSVDTVDLPVDFFLQGWIYALSKSEVALWLMLAREKKLLTTADGLVSVVGKQRQRVYGVSKDAYKGWWLLDSVGLLEAVVDPNRRANGTVEDFDPEDLPALHQFKLLNQGFSQPAAHAVIAALAAAIEGDAVGLQRYTDGFFN